MNKLRTQIVLAVNGFLLLVVGSVMLFYFFFAENYYIMRKEAVMNEAFEKIHQFDLTRVEPENEEAIQALEEESFTVIICNEQWELVYSSRMKDYEQLIDEKIRGQQEQYRADAEAVYSEEEKSKPISLCGLITQNGQDFYVYIYENTWVMSRNISYVNHFLSEVLIGIVLLGTVFACALATWIVKPVERIQKVANRLAQNDFSARIPDHKPNNEVGKLAGDINIMAEKIQRNINDLNNYNYLLLRQNHDMAEFEEMRKKLVGNITHQLKTPLAIISSQVELLQFEYDTDKKEYYFESIMEEIEKMSHLISSILQNSKLEHEIQNTTLKDTDLSQVLLDLLPKYEAWFSSVKIRFRAEIESDCIACADRIQVEQAINNYMMNARRHTKPGKTVKLSLRSVDEGCYLSVYNEGSNIAEDELDQIWTGFYQADGPHGDGTTEIGLGLYIVKDIMHQHGGTCGVINRDGGVEFWLMFVQ